MATRSTITETNSLRTEAAALPPATVEVVELVELVERRGAVLGPPSRLLYRAPVHLVTGRGAHLTDADGEDYLDVHHNVASVSHAHPRVVEAIAAQAARLNTHTRYLHERIVGYSEDRLALDDQAALTGEQILDITGGRSMLSVAVRGGVAEHHRQEQASRRSGAWTRTRDTTSTSHSTAANFYAWSGRTPVRRQRQAVSSASRCRRRERPRETPPHAATRSTGSMWWPRASSHPPAAGTSGSVAPRRQLGTGTSRIASHPCS